MIVKRLIRGLLRALAGAVLLVAGLIVTLLVVAGVEHRMPLALPTPTGPFTVGRTSFDWVNPSITDELAPIPGTKREIVAWVWYPAAPVPTATTAEYMPATWRTADMRYSGILVSRFLTRDLSQVHTHSIRDGTLAPVDRSYPVVILRAGGGALTTDYTTLAEDLASHGYVVVGFDAPYRTAVVVLSGGRVITRPPARNPEALPAAEQARLIKRLLPMWCTDVAFVLDRLETLNASDPSGRFTGRLDLQHIGVFGHSFGGATAAEFCHEDSRCKAGIDLDGAPFGPVIQSGLRQPFMFVLSDQNGSGPEVQLVFAHIQSIYDRLPVDSRLRIKILGANHFSFSDQILLKSQVVLRLMRMMGVLRLDGRRGLAITADYVGTFFDAYLKGRSGARLQALERKYPEVRIQ